MHRRPVHGQWSVVVVLQVAIDRDRVRWSRCSLPALTTRLREFGRPDQHLCRAAAAQDAGASTNFRASGCAVGSVKSFQPGQRILDSCTESAGRPTTIYATSVSGSQIRLDPASNVHRTPVASYACSGHSENQATTTTKSRLQSWPSAKVRSWLTKEAN